MFYHNPVKLEALPQNKLLETQRLINLLFLAINSDKHECVPWRVITGKLINLKDGSIIAGMALRHNQLGK
jgi:hypothetical protein